MTTDTERPEPRTAAALAARRRSTQAALDRIHDAINRLRREKAPVSVAAVARRAAVSRTFLYTNPDAKAAIAQAVTREPQPDSRFTDRRDKQQEATWHERALNAEDALRPRTPRSSPNAAVSVNSSAASATSNHPGPRTRSSGSRPRTPPSSSACSSSPPTTAPSTNASMPPDPTCGSKTAASPTSRHNWPHRSTSPTRPVALQGQPNDTPNPYSAKGSPRTCKFRQSAGHTRCPVINGR